MSNPNKFNVPDDAVVPENVTALSLDALASVGLKGINKNASNVIRNAGGFVPKGASPEFLSVAASVVQNAKSAASAGRKTALALALMEESKEYQHLKGPDDKYFKSVTAVFAAMFPTLASSTARNYLNAGRTVYLPASRGELEPELMILDTLEPGTALSACGALNDETARKALPAAIKEVMGNKKTLSQSALKKAVQTARKTDSDEPTDRENGTSPTPRSDIEAADATELEALRVAIKRVFMPDDVEGELHFTIGEDRRRDFVTMIAAASRDSDSALKFVKAFALASGIN